MFDNYKSQFAQKFPACTTQYANVCLPVCIQPFASVGTVSFECCEKPTIVDPSACCGQKNVTCTFAISQKIKISVPVEFGANVGVGETLVDCKCTEGSAAGANPQNCGCAPDKEVVPCVEDPVPDCHTDNKPDNKPDSGTNNTTPPISNNRTWIPSSGSNGPFSRANCR